MDILLPFSITDQMVELKNKFTRHLKITWWTFASFAVHPKIWGLLHRASILNKMLEKYLEALYCMCSKIVMIRLNGSVALLKIYNHLSRFSHKLLYGLIVFKNTFQTSFTW